MTIATPPVRAAHARLAGAVATGTLLGVGALHAAWGAGSSWPMDDRTDLVDAVVGARRPDALDRGVASYVVAATLGAAAAAVAGRPKRFEGPRRTAVAAIAVALAARGVLGLTGHTSLVSPLSTGERFRRLDRRIYSPACLSLAALTALSLTGSRRPGPRS
jgi:hypothetical protein